MQIAPEMKPYFEFTLINCFAICSFCAAEQDFSSSAPQCSDKWYLDMAAAMWAAGWIIPERQVAACPTCAANRRLTHNANAFHE